MNNFCGKAFILFTMYNYNTTMIIMTDNDKCTSDRRPLVIMLFTWYGWISIRKDHGVRKHTLWTRKIKSRKSKLSGVKGVLMTLFWKIPSELYGLGFRLDLTYKYSLTIILRAPSMARICCGEASYMGNKCSQNYYVLILFLLYF